ncbi:hypothetical protein VTO73DRAFT_3539 [Trametes versicolor]
MSASGARVDVDDRDPRIQYSNGWTRGENGGAYDSTLSYALDQGLTATLTFTGTLVGVMGCSGDTSRYGWPSESYVIDGTSYGIRSDLTASPDTVYFNVTFFTSLSLTPGVHTIVLTNMNGTVPNTLCLDRFWYISSDTTTADVPQSTTASSYFLNSLNSRNIICYCYSSILAFYHHTILYPIHFLYKIHLGSPIPCLLSFDIERDLQCLFLFLLFFYRPGTFFYFHYTI